MSARANCHSRSSPPTCTTSSWTGARRSTTSPAEFFALTFPTYNLRELAKDVVHRLAGKNDKTIRQLELTYGGGKTHTLITLLHLVQDPRGLPDLPAVHEFVQHIGMNPPRTQVAALAFDKLDAEKGMEVKGPAGERRRIAKSLFQGPEELQRLAESSAY